MRFPIHVAEASGSRFVDVDGIEYVDFCLGDTGAMAGHSGPAVAEAITRQASIGLTTMLPSADAAWVGAELARRFTAPEVAAGDDGDRRQPVRAALRPSPHRSAEDRGDGLVLPRHGRRDAGDPRTTHGHVVSRPGAIGPQVDPALTTRVVPFNDLDALDRALDHGDVAAVLMEPALTNIGIVLPERRLPRRGSASSPARTARCS